MNDHFSGCPCPNCKPSRGVWWALGSVGALSALSLWGSARRGSAAGHTLGDLANVKKDMRKADFWLKQDGEPTRTFNKKFIGIKIRRTDILLPDYAFYMMMHIYNQKMWPTHIVNVPDVRSLPLATK
jgi:hypothetical protein